MIIIWRHGPPLVRAIINGPGEVSMEVKAVLDTGASSVMISPLAASILGYDLEEAPEVRLYSASGFFRAKKLSLSKVAVGNIFLEDVRAVCADFPSKKFDALLSLSWINSFAVTFNKKENEILID